MQLCFSQLKKRPLTSHTLTFLANSGSLSCYYYSEATHSKMQAFEQRLWWMVTYLVHSNHSFFTNIYNHIHRNRLRITHNQLAIGTESAREKVLGANWPFLYVWVRQKLPEQLWPIHCLTQPIMKITIFPPLWLLLFPVMKEGSYTNQEKLPGLTKESKEQSGISTS